MEKEYRILPAQSIAHGLLEDGLIKNLGYELFKREGIRLVSMGIYPSEEEAKKIAKKHASPGTPKFV